MSRYKIKPNGIPVIGQGPTEDEQQIQRIILTANAVLSVVAASTHQLAEGIDATLTVLGQLLAQMLPDDEGLAKVREMLKGTIIQDVEKVYIAALPSVREALAAKNEASA